MDNLQAANLPIQDPFKQTYFHGTRADLKIGDLISTGYTSNYVDGQLRHIYLASTLNAAVWGAELAAGTAKQRIYLVEPTGELEHDPNVTNKRFPGNPTMSYRSTSPFKVVGEVTVWQGHSDEQIRSMKEALQKLKDNGAMVIEE